MVGSRASMACKALIWLDMTGFNLIQPDLTGNGAWVSLTSEARPTEPQLSPIHI